MEDLETLLQQNRERTNKVYEKNINKTNFGKAEKNTNLFGFIEMISNVLKKTMPNITFIPDDGKKMKLDPMKDFDKTLITYRTLERKPYDKEKKPRVREQIEKFDNSDDIADIYGQKFNCEIEFNIIASEYSTVEKVMEKFEDLIFLYTGYFKKNGVSELFFKKQITDEYYDYLRETLSVRNLIYSVDIEKITVISIEKINNINIFMQESAKKEENK